MCVMLMMVVNMVGFVMLTMLWLYFVMFILYLCISCLYLWCKYRKAKKEPIIHSNGAPGALVIAHSRCAITVWDSNGAPNVRHY